MFKRILVPLDGSVLAESTLAPAALLAKRCEADLLLLGAARERAFPGFLTGTAQPTAGRIERYLAMAATLLKAEGISVEALVVTEKPASGIATQSIFHGIDLIVMATHGRAGLGALLHPSVAWGVLEQSSVPVLVLKHPDGEERTPDTSKLPRFLTDPAAPIIVPLDGSLRSERALPLAQKFAWIYAHPLVLVRAATLPYLAGGMIDYPVMLDNLQQWTLKETGDYLQHKRDELACTGLEVKTDSLLGGAVECIEASIQDHDAGLVVIASHGRGGLSRLLLGSVARRVLSRVEVPVMLVPTARIEDQRKGEVA